MNTTSASTVIDQRIAEIDAEKARLATLDNERAALMKERDNAIAAQRKEVISSIPGLLGVGTLDEAIALMRGLTPSTAGAASGKGHRYSPEVRAQVRAALEAKTPVSKISKHMRIGQATIWIWKREWGLTASNTHRAPKTARRVAKRRAKSTPMMDEMQKARLLVKLQEGKTPISKLAQEFGRSRARIYQFAHIHGVKTPGTFAAA